MVHDIIVRSHPFGQFTAHVWGIPEVSAAGSTEQEAIESVKKLLTDWLKTAKWVRVDVPAPHYTHPVFELIGKKDPNDPMEQEYLAELARMKVTVKQLLGAHLQPDEWWRREDYPGLGKGRGSGWPCSLACTTSMP